jgi:hypothetical protein
LLAAVALRRAARRVFSWTEPGSRVGSSADRAAVPPQIRRGNAPRTSGACRLPSPVVARSGEGHGLRARRYDVAPASPIASVPVRSRSTAGARRSGRAPGGRIRARKARLRRRSSFAGRPGGVRVACPAIRRGAGVADRFGPRSLPLDRWRPTERARSRGGRIRVWKARLRRRSSFAGRAGGARVACPAIRRGAGVADRFGPRSLPLDRWRPTKRARSRGADPGPEGAPAAPILVRGSSGRGTRCVPGDTTWRRRRRSLRSPFAPARPLAPDGAGALQGGRIRVWKARLRRRSSFAGRAGGERVACPAIRRGAGVADRLDPRSLPLDRWRPTKWARSRGADLGPEGAPAAPILVRVPGAVR